jgi:hypothetical protein
LLQDPSQVDAVLKDFRTAPITEAKRALLAYIYDAIMVCGLFNFYNRWIDAAGVKTMSKRDHAASRKRLATQGYTLAR